MNPCAWKWPFWVSATLLALLLAGAGALFEPDLGVHAFWLMFVSFCEEAFENGLASAPLPDADWQCAFFFGLLLGAFSAAAAGGGFRFDAGFGEEGGRSPDRFIATTAGWFLGGGCVFAGFFVAGNSIWGEWHAASSGAVGGWVFLAALLVTAGIAGLLWQKTFGRLMRAAPAKRRTQNKSASEKPAKKAAKGGGK